MTESSLVMLHTRAALPGEATGFAGGRCFQNCTINGAKTPLDRPAQGARWRINLVCRKRVVASLTYSKQTSAINASVRTEAKLSYLFTVA